MIVVCEMSVCLLGGSGGMLPQENFEFTSSQIASDAINLGQNFQTTF